IVPEIIQKTIFKSYQLEKPKKIPKFPFFNFQLYFMKKILLPLTLIAAPITAIHAQQQIEVEQIWNGTFRTNQLNALNTLHTKNQYSVLDYNRNTNSFTIDAFDFTTLEKVQTLFSS